MPTTSADFHLLDGDTAPAAPDAGFSRFFFLNGRPQMRRPGQAPIDLMPRWTIQFAFAGEVELDAFFGWHTVPEAVLVTRLELEAQEGASSPITITLTDAAGTSLGRTITLGAGDRYAVADIADLALAAGAVVRAKITGMTAEEIAAWLTLRIFITPQ